MSADQLTSLYRSLKPGVQTLFVFPPVRTKYPDTDYLYQLYRSFIEDDDPAIQLQSIDKWQHHRPILGQLSGGNTILHYHWMEFQRLLGLLGVIWKLCCMAFYKILGGGIVWTFHNLEPHHNRYPTGNRILFRVMIVLADRLHFHCDSAIDDASQIYPINREKCVVIPHPDFPVHETDRETAISKLNSKYDLQITSADKMLLSFGSIAEYKQMDEVISLVGEHAPDIKLVIAGVLRFGKDSHFERLKTLANRNENVILLARFLPEEDVPVFMQASHGVIYNHRQMLSSGGIELARSYGKTVIAPKTGCVKEQAGNPKFQLFDDKTELIEILKRLESSL